MDELTAPQELVFTVKQAFATPAKPITLEQAGLKEVQHLQEWVIAHPEILGPNVLLVTAELGKWVTTGGTKEADRLDVLGVDDDGTLVVGELKRGAAPDTVEMQALKYAAMASNFTFELLVEQRVHYLHKRGKEISAEEARTELLDHAPLLEDAPDSADETLGPARMVLVASSFPPGVTTTSTFLSDFGIEIALVQFRAYLTPGDEIVLTVSRLFPLPDIDLIGPAATTRTETRQRRKAAKAVARLVDAEAVEDDTVFTFFVLSEGGAGAEQVRNGWRRMRSGAVPAGSIIVPGHLFGSWMRNSTVHRSS